MAMTTYSFSKASDFAGAAVEPAQLNNELIAAGYTPLKIVYDHGDNITVHIDDAVDKSSIDTEAATHAPV